MRLLVATLVATIAIGLGFVILVFTENVPFVGGASNEGGGLVDRERVVDDFDERAAFDFLQQQVELGPRPAGSQAAAALAERLRSDLPGGRFQELPGGLRNLVGEVPGRAPDRLLVVGGHYDTKDLPGFVGANDGASGTAVVRELARTIRPRELEPTVRFILFDGEESPRGTPDDEFMEAGLRGSRRAVELPGRPEAMINVDLVGDRELSLPREENSNPELWERLRRAAERAGYGPVFPPETQLALIDDHIPFIEEGVPAIDLIDFDFDCFHERCDDLSVVSERSLDAAGESLLALLRDLGRR
jgi:glutaminyl-peptide cyclotransferase